MFPKNLDEDSDEGSNADSDFSGDDNTPAPAGGNIVAAKKKKSKKKAATKKNLKPVKDVGKEKSTPTLLTNMINPVRNGSEPNKPADA